MTDATAIYARRELDLECARGLFDQAEDARRRGRITAEQLDAKWDEYRAEERRIHLACKAAVAKLA